jgi:hypothetical protein
VRQDAFTWQPGMVLATHDVQWREFVRWRLGHQHN